MSLLPFIHGRQVLRGMVLALSLAYLSACSPRLISSQPAVDSPGAVHEDPARDAQLSLLREAHKAFVQERYVNAVTFFRRFVEVAQDSPRLSEARWWLGRTYERLGDFRAAIEQYRVLAVGDGQDKELPQGYRLHALHRLDELRQVPAMAPVAVPRQMAMALSLAQVPPVGSWVGWFQALLQAGISVLVLDPGIANFTQGETFDQLRALVGAAHLSGLAVWVVFDAHHGVGIPSHQDWRSIGVAGDDGVLGGVRPDVTHPGYQDVVEEQARRLAFTGCDGLLLRARANEGFAREYSDGAWQRFASSFGGSMAPAQLLGQPVNGGPEVEAQYWRWVGWKARAYVTLAARISARLREGNPTARLVMEVHRASVSAPLVGLEQYGEDVAELVQRTGGAVVVRQEGSGVPAMPQVSGISRGSADRWWLEIGVPGGESWSVSEWVGAALATVPEQGSWNLVIQLPETARVP